MPRPPRLSAARWAALACMLIAVFVTVHWGLGLEFGRLLPGLTEVGLVSPLLLLVGGATAWFMADWPGGRAPGAAARHAVQGLALLMALMPVLMLVEAMSGRSLGIDIARPGVLPTSLNPHPGRISPNGCVALLLLSGSVGLLAGLPGALARRLSAFGITVAAFIAGLGILGYLLNLEQLYHWGSFNRLTLPTAAGLGLLALSLWEIRLRWSGVRERIDLHEQRITRRSLAVLALVAVAAGTGGFAALESEFERTRKEDVHSTATVTGEALASAVDGGVWLAQTIATRPVVVEQLAALASNPEDKARRERLRSITRSLLTAGVTAARFVDAAGAPLADAGAFAAQADTPSLALARDYAATSRLVWASGFVLATDLPITDKGEVVGRFQSEQRLALMDRLVMRIRDADASSDVLICNRVDKLASCVPSKLYPKAFTIPMYDANGNVNLPINRALLGESGVLLTPDLRGVPVVAAYVPLGRTGLAMVVKADIEAVFAVIRQRLGWLALLLTALTLLGTWVLRQHVRPLVKQLAGEQARCRAILDNSNDAFIGLNSDSLVTDWNLQAERLFGYTAAEAMGQRLSDLIIPPESRAAHEAGMARFRQTGHGRVVNQRVEVVALHRDGRQLDVELSVAAMAASDGYAAHAFVRDISQRKAAARQLAASEQRMRDVTNAIPAMVGVFDAEERCIYANDLALKVHNLGSDTAIGMPMREGLGEASYALHEAHVKAVLQGRRQTFEGSLPWRDGTGYFQIHLVPMRDAQTDAVNGFYLMTFDITALRSAQLKQERSERRLRAITDNLPALISHLDTDGRYLFANRQFQTLLNLQPQRLLGQRIDDVRDKDYVEQIRPWLDKAMAGQTVVFESETGPRDGEVRQYQQTYVPEFDADGRVVGVFAVTFDITERKLAAQRLSDAQSHLKAIADNLPVLISYIDRHHRLTFVNKTFEEWMGVDPELAIGSHLKALIGPDLYAQRQQALEQALRGERVEFELVSQALGLTRHLHTVYIPDRRADGNIAGVYTLSTDITATKDVERRLQELARIDPLTRLPNRREFEERLALALARCRRSHKALALIFMDVDHFKSINDGHGHAAGDAVLKEFAARIRRAVRSTDTAARLAGDEFVVILEGLQSDTEASQVAAKLVDAIRLPMPLPAGGEILVTTSVGMACWGGVGEGAEDLLERADRALYRAKAAGRDTFAQTIF
ncbi:diguanylate cyclase (GGDEF)-like protein/PAS domain S-box-containing protein [Pelomonas saccharophila]|uniref:Diguanylate cyclase (GGDEF)-like protein/PAS domain S-box-containing protein n=1 Tax=Roseateles saccharophilus TaxID=304 RepID=A0ABU1YSX9_ROSSA|nr:PAS domain-containing protein [Roseateles saccharophilus]MDR7271964.1 diguanylate cyclase (GGDEF)-like protein/PAS domain S-box-containing protein [Roseateles saccharophilus]